MVEGTGFENRHRGNSIAGSNPALSAQSFKWRDGYEIKFFNFIRSNLCSTSRCVSRLEGGAKKARSETERWLSGLRRTLGKRVRVYALRGFESPSLRTKYSNDLYSNIFDQIQHIEEGFCNCQQILLQFCLVNFRNSFFKTDLFVREKHKEMITDK